ncbi:MAG: hypothetical protein H6838_02325 [Planctomycetes bacterium]|nr:hypothetical protein [Planctomycetota bacterium]
MKRHLLPVLLPLLFLLSGCLEFDAQDVVIHHDAANDRVDVLLIYRGLIAEGDPSDGNQIKEALGDLDKCLATGEFAFWCNWPFKVDPTLEPKGLRQDLLQHLEVENGGLFTDPLGKLCGYQFVRIVKATEFFAKLDNALQVALQAGLLAGFPDDKGPNHKVDADTRDYVKEFLREKEKMIVAAPGHLELRLPCSAADHRWLKGRLERYALLNAAREMVRREGVAELRASGGSVLRTSVADESVALAGPDVEKSLAKAPSFRFFWDNDFSFVHHDGLTTVSLGTGESDEITITKSSEGIYHEEFLAAVRERGDKIEAGVPDQELARRFAAFHGRDAVLPPKLAEKRGAKAEEPVKGDVLEGKGR